MFWDRDRLAAGDLPPVVIVGSGPAGVSLALRLAGQGVGSVVLEAGGEAYSPASQDFYRGRVIGDPYHALDAARLRYFGGTSNHWTGYCRTLDAEDFEARADIPHSGWPIARADIAPYAEGAAEILEIDANVDRPLEGSVFVATRQASPAVRFGEKYAGFFRTSEIAHLCLETAVGAIRAEEGRITALDLRAPDGTAFEIRPRAVVLCTGGIENSRLLLWSNRTSPRKVVAEDRALGRYWMEHPEFALGEIRLDRPLFGPPRGTERLTVAAKHAAIRRHGVMNGLMHFQDVPRGWNGGAKAIARELACAAPALGEMVYTATDRTLECHQRVIAEWEQAPVAENRVALSETGRDAHGVPRPELHWRKTERDYRTARVLMELLGRHAVRQGLGRVRVHDFVIEERLQPDNGWYSAYHHMGGTRMAATPREGVVDRDLRIFGLSNGYVLGSSVFATGGYANPTQTIVMLALRLGDHLGQKVGTL